MSRWSIILAIVAATLAALSALLYRGLLEERAARADLAAEMDALLRHSGGEPASGHRGPATGEIQSLPPMAIATSPENARSADAREPAAQRAAERYRERLRDPEYRAATLAQYRLNFEMNFPELAADLGLTPELTSRLFDLMARQHLDAQESNMELNALLATKPQTDMRAGRQEYSRLVAERDRQFQAEQQQLLGTEKYALWREYVDSREARGQLRELRSRLAGGASPLQEQQFDQLVPLLAAEYQRYRNEIQTLHESAEAANDAPDVVALWNRRVELLEEHQQRALDSLKPYMDAEQLRQLQYLQAAELQREQNHLRMQRASRELQALGNRP
jgi:hypothetical protein